MKIRLVAYRKATTSATVDSSYELDLLKEPNISLNFQFSDVKEPEKRKANFSQTFKLPFTDNNNKFFQNWYNVNLETLVFDTRTGFDAILYAGGVSQFEGILQLKGVYQKAQYYQVVLLSNAADLFSVIGNKKLKDIFKEADGGYSEDLDHTFNATNLGYSWDGSSTDFENINNVSLRDADAGVQKVMYPFSFSLPTAYYDGITDLVAGEYLNNSTNDGSTLVPITQFKPAIQIKELFKRIFSQAGFSYTSSFIDGNYFGKIFMTTCNHTGLPKPQMKPPTNVGGVMVVGNSTSWGNVTVPGGIGIVGDLWRVFEANQVSPISSSYPLPADATDAWDEVNNVFTKTSPLQGGFTENGYNFLNVTTNFTVSNVSAVCSWEGMLAKAKIVDYNTTTGVVDWDTIHGQTVFPITPTQTASNSYTVSLNIDITAMNVGESGKIYISVDNWCPSDNTQNATITYGGAATDSTYGCYGLISLSWQGLSPEVYGQQVLVPEGIDPTITQKAFLKDIIERFNLVFLSDPNDPYNIIIEPYNDYLAAGSIKNWTEKIDTLKEINIKDTTSLQKKEILFNDLEDVDIVNKSIKEEEFDLNVYGKFNNTTYNNDFAQGTLTNNPIFSPYINEKVFVNADDIEAPTQLSNVAAHYEFSYQQVEGGYENKLEPTKPKLFYYCGTPTTLINSGTNTTPTIYMHYQDATGIQTFSFQTYPLCSPYELIPSSGVSTIKKGTKSLYWGSAPPRCPQLLVFNSTNGVVSENSLYYNYWENYLNNIYGEDARIMECYLNLNEVDILNFKFNDEIFIKDSYWRILKLQNYQVGAKVSTKAILLKINQSYDGTCYDCNYVLGSIGNYNTWFGNYVWCPPETPNCTPTVDLIGNDIEGLFADPECCECLGGTVVNFPPPASSGLDASLRACESNSSSLPAWIQNQTGARAFFSNTQAKTFLSGKFSSVNRPLIVGTNNTKTSTRIMPYNGDDLVIKFRNNNISNPSINGESHKMVLTGYTSGTTTGYAYPQGVSGKRNLIVPFNSNMIIKIKGTCSVVGGTNASYPVGSTEAFSYYTAFKNAGGTVTQIGTAGGVQEFNISEGTPRTSLAITSANGELKFGLLDGLTDTKRIWSLTVDLTVQLIENMTIGYEENWALYQNGDIIQLQNNDFLIWN